MKYRKALTIGVNYAGTDHELRGCLNDASDWSDFLRSNHFDVTTLLEQQATRAAILSGVTDLIVALNTGDIGVITYSGHGTWWPDPDGEADGHDEAICPFDMSTDGQNLITNDEFHLLFNKIENGATVLFLTDCCHSGTIFRFMPSPLGHEDMHASRPRFLPPSHLVRDPKLAAKIERAFSPNVGNSASSAAPLPNLVHISACRDAEYAADAFINNRFNGAYTYYLLQALTMQLQSGGTYQAAHQQLRKSLPSRAYPQCPLLNAPIDLKKAKIFAP